MVVCLSTPGLPRSPCPPPSRPTLLPGRLRRHHVSNCPSFNLHKILSPSSMIQCLSHPHLSPSPLLQCHCHADDSLERGTLEHHVIHGLLNPIDYYPVVTKPPPSIRVSGLRPQPSFPHHHPFLRCGCKGRRVSSKSSYRRQQCLAWQVSVRVPHRGST